MVVLKLERVGGPDRGEEGSELAQHFGIERSILPLNKLERRVHPRRVWASAQAEAGRGQEAIARGSRFLSSTSLPTFRTFVKL